MWYQQIMHQFFKKHGLSLQQYNVLRILRGQKGNAATINLISDRMLDKMSNASRLVSKLVQKGLVSREINELDRRAVDVIITKKGLDLLEKLGPMVDNQDLINKTFTEDDAELLSNLLDKLRNKKN